MNDPTELAARIEALAGTAVAEPDAARMQAIEDRVMRTIGEGPDRRRGRGVRLLGIAAAAVLLIAGLVVVSAGNEPTLLRAADAVTLERPGEAAVAGVAGDELPDGTIVEIHGSAVVDGDRYGPGRYVVVDGRLEPIVPPASTTTSVAAASGGSETPVRPPPAPPPTTAERTGDPAPERDAPPSTRLSTTTATPVRGSEPAPTTAPSRPAGTSVPDRSRPTTTPPATSATTPRTTPTTTTTTTTNTRPTTTTTRPTTTTTRQITTTTTTTASRRGDRP